MLATGNIKMYQIVMGTLYAGSFILCYVFFKIGLGPEFGYISTIIAFAVAVFVRLWLLKRMIPEFSPKIYIVQVLIKAILVILISTGISFALKKLCGISNIYLELLFVLIVSMLSVAFVTYALALSKIERHTVNTQFKKFIRKIS